ncbi:carboxypeptidase-like regulatory domain-containing protein [Salinicola aestuarinus]|uniref:carboxypeptidase-like regulatory domain-containing protein n=1 Tax=Salinicola aestuarinus TaxID=1949082 RepID=UPI000DA217E0|nr:carboxypeptidase-like regulatory domain-containing protein [Salinicola aestuarinus]
MTGRRLRAIGALTLMTLVLAGCESLSTGSLSMPQIFDSPGDEETVVARQVEFPADEYAKLDKQGSAAVQGRLTYTAPGGDTVIGADELISVAPATRYAAEAADVALSGRKIEPADPRARAYTHTARTNADGYFVVRGLPAGVFYVAGSVLLPGGDARSPIIIRQVELTAGQARDVDLSR